MKPELKTFLICCYPRSRSLWLSRFFSVPGVCVCEHEATEFAASSSEFWERAERVSGHAAVYGNSDSANIFVLPALLAARPLTRVVWVDRPMVEVVRSLRRAGFDFDGHQAANLIGARHNCEAYIDRLVSFKQLEQMDYGRALWEFLLGDYPFDQERWEAFKDQKIAYTARDCAKKETEKFRRFLASETGYLKCEA
jgi:hypothetical protein